MSGSSPRVSVVLAVHDGERFLRPALVSVLRQSVSDVEVVVVDDCSGDATPAILDAIDDPRLRVVRNERQEGLAASLNRGLDLATGRYVARLDADDVALPRRLELQLAAIAARTGLGVVGSSVLDIDERGRPGALHTMPGDPAAVRWHALFSSPFYHPTVLLDRELLERHDLRYDTTFAESEDYELWSRVLAVADGVNLPEPTVLYRVHAAQATQRRRDLQRTLQHTVARRQLEELAAPLADDELDLAWRLGAGDGVEPGRREKAARALLTVLASFEGRHGITPEVRQAVARTLARSGAVRAAARLDPLLLLHASTRRAHRHRRAREARDAARVWRRELAPASEPGRAVRVTAVFPEPTPYRAPLLDLISARPEVDLTVVHAAETVVERTWTVSGRHREITLRGVRIPGVRRILRHDYPVTPDIWRALEESDPDVVVVEGWSTFAAQGATLWARRRRVPYVLLTSSHDHDPRRTWRKIVKSAVVPRVIRHADSVLVSGTLVRESMREWGAAPDRIRVFAYTVDVEAFAESADGLATRRVELRARLGAHEDDVVVLYVGRLAPEKDVETLVHAVAAANDRRLLLVLVGQGPEQEALARLASELDVRLVLQGDVAWERITELYVAADVFALVSRHEPWGVVVNEAAACGLPLVLSDHVGAAPDLLRDGENGFLVPTEDVAAAAHALRRLADDRGLRQRQGARSRELVAGWGYGPSVDAFVASVLDAAAGPGNR